MRNLLKNTLLAILLFEFCLSYLYYVDKSFEKSDDYKPAIISTFLELKEKISLNRKITLSCDMPNNIFEIYNPKSDVLGSQIRYEVQSYKSTLKQMSLNSKSNNNFTIIMLGGSELMGYSHPDKKIHSILQSKLRDFFQSDHINILNAGNAGAFLKDEIYIFNDLKRNLNIDMVIQHTGFNDSAYLNDMVNFENKLLDFSYDKELNSFVKQKKGLHIAINAEGHDLSKYGSRESCNYPLDTREKNLIFLEKFKADMEHFTNDLKKNNIHHIIGIQGYDEFNNQLKIENPIRVLQTFYSNNEDVINFNTLNLELDWYNSSHTSQMSAFKIANIYFEEIIDTHSKNIERKILK